MDSMSSVRAVTAMPVGPVRSTAFWEKRPANAYRDGATTGATVAASSGALEVTFTPSQDTPVEGDDAEGSAVAVRSVAGEPEKDRWRNVALSVGCRRCLSSETLYDLVSLTHESIGRSYSLFVYIAVMWSAL